LLFLMPAASTTSVPEMVVAVSDGRCVVVGKRFMQSVTWLTKADSGS